MVKKAVWRCLVMVIFSLCISISILAVQGQSAAALEISGTGLVEDVVITNWGSYGLVERYYSSNNNFNFHKIWKVRGYDLFGLLGAGNLKTDQNYNVIFIASDGARFSRTVGQLQSLYYYPDFTIGTAQPVMPMIGFYRTALFEPDYQGLPAAASWSDRALTEADLDNEAPRLYLGQAYGNVSDKNQQFFLRGLVRIIVGEERPAAPPPAEEPGQPPSGTDPGNGTQPPSGTNPGNGTQPPSGTDPGNGTQPPAGTDPGNGTQPPAGTDPGNGTQPPPGTDPGNGTQPPAGTDPGNGTQPPSGTNPGNGTQPPAGTQDPANGVQPPAGTQDPANGTKPPDNPETSEGDEQDPDLLTETGTMTGEKTDTDDNSGSGTVERPVEKPENESLSDQGPPEEVSVKRSRFYIPVIVIGMLLVLAAIAAPVLIKYKKKKKVGNSD